jgi:hypothetical protein
MIASRYDMFKMKAPLRLLPEFEGNDAVIGNGYYNRTYLFGVRRPSNRWRIALERNIKKPPEFGFHTETLDKARWISKLIRYSGDEIWGEALIAVLPSDTSKTPTWWARKLLGEITTLLYSPDSMVVTQDVTAQGTGIFQRAFFMVELPERKSIEFPVMIPFFRTREDIALAIICRAKFETYDLVKADFEKILSSFAWFKD